MGKAQRSYAVYHDQEIRSPPQTFTADSAWTSTAHQ